MSRRTFGPADLDRAFAAFGEALRKAGDAMEQARRQARMSQMAFQPGDIVTRDGTDRQRVIQVLGDLMEVECTRAPASGRCAVGEREHNLVSRYRWPADLEVDHA